MNSGNFIISAFSAIDNASLQVYLNEGTHIEEIKDSFDEKPIRATEYSAGYDLRVLEDVTIHAKSSTIITFGDVIRVENSLSVGVVVPRSSLAKKRGLVLANGPYYVYKGTGNHLLSLKFINFTDADVEVKRGDKIAQVVFIKCPKWLTGDMDELKDGLMEEDIMLQDPLDEQIMSPQFNNNIERVDTNEPVDSNCEWFYAFQAPEDVVLEPDKVTCIMTGLKCKCGIDQVFLLKCAVNNSCVELANCIGVVDADYYGNPDNDGEIGVLLLNRGIHPVQIHEGDVIANGSLYYYGLMVNDSYGGKRLGGFGSTDK